MRRARPNRSPSQLSSHGTGCAAASPGCAHAAHEAVSARQRPANCGKRLTPTALPGPPLGKATTSRRQDTLWPKGGGQAASQASFWQLLLSWKCLP